jgi:hypothetical protein
MEIPRELLVWPPPATQLGDVRLKESSESRVLPEAYFGEPQRVIRPVEG